jgi:hypothetical protein
MWLYKYNFNKTCFYHVITENNRVNSTMGIQLYNRFFVILRLSGRSLLVGHGPWKSKSISPSWSVSLCGMSDDFSKPFPAVINHLTPFRGKFTWFVFIKLNCYNSEKDIDLLYILDMSIVKHFVQALRYSSSLSRKFALQHRDDFGDHWIFAYNHR